MFIFKIDESTIRNSRPKNKLDKIGIRSAAVKKV